MNRRANHVRVNERDHRFFGAAIIVPVIIFVIAKVFKVTTKIFLSAVYAGVALQGFTKLLFQRLSIEWYRAQA